MSANKNYSTAVGDKLKQYAAGGPYNLLADGPSANANQTARQIQMCDAGALSSLKDADGNEMGPFNALLAGFTLSGHFSSVTTSVSIVVTW
jgi:hypothetical protein